MKLLDTFEFDTESSTIYCLYQNQKKLYIIEIYVNGKQVYMNKCKTLEDIILGLAIFIMGKEQQRNDL